MTTRWDKLVQQISPRRSVPIILGIFPPYSSSQIPLVPGRFHPVPPHPLDQTQPSETPTHLTLSKTEFCEAEAFTHHTHV